MQLAIDIADREDGRISWSGVDGGLLLSGPRGVGKTTRERAVFDAFRRLFTDCGLATAIRSDNGLPFASPNGLP
jgi:hypothetical protein